MAIKIKRLVLRYFRTITSEASIDVAVVVQAPEVGYCDMQVREDWDPVRYFDPNADISLLKALFQEMQDNLRDPAQSRAVLADIEQLYSNMVQGSDTCEYFIDVEPAAELNRLGLTILASETKDWARRKGHARGSKVWAAEEDLLHARVPTRWLT